MRVTDALGGAPLGVVDADALAPAGLCEADTRDAVDDGDAPRDSVAVLFDERVGDCVLVAPAAPGDDDEDAPRDSVAVTFDERVSRVLVALTVTVALLIVVPVAFGEAAGDRDGDAPSDSVAVIFDERVVDRVHVAVTDLVEFDVDDADTCALARGAADRHARASAAASSALRAPRGARGRAGAEGFDTERMASRVTRRRARRRQKQTDKGAGGGAGGAPVRQRSGVRF